MERFFSSLLFTFDVSGSTSAINCIVWGFVFFLSICIFRPLINHVWEGKTQKEKQGCQPHLDNACVCAFFLSSPVGGLFFSQLLKHLWHILCMHLSLKITTVNIIYSSRITPCNPVYEDCFLYPMQTLGDNLGASESKRELQLQYKWRGEPGFSFAQLCIITPFSCTA